MASTSDFRNGFTMRFNGKLVTITEFQHVKPGKGPAFVRTKLKNVETGKVVDKTFPSGHKVDAVRIERRPYQYLYKDDMGYNFMNMQTYDQISLEGKLIEASRFLMDGQDVEILFLADEERALLCDLPQQVIQKVTTTEPGVRGNTATNVTKPATLESGATVNVPIFINEGDRIKVDTKTGSYLERVRN
ncbi:MAG: elongation factor P [Chitinophagales bacterium]